MGDAVAFFEDDPAKRVSVVMVDRAGKRQVLSGGWADWWNLAWSPDGEEVWFGAAKGGGASSLYAVSRSGAVRTLLAAPGALELHDVSRDGSVLVSRIDARSRTFGAQAGAAERELSWLEDSRVTDLSSDGSEALMRVDTEREPGAEVSYLRSTDGAPPVRLGIGNPQDLSGDGKWALAIRGRTLVALPTAAGAEKTLEMGRALAAARWIGDEGQAAFFVATEADGSSTAGIAGFGGAPARIVASGLRLRAATVNAFQQVSPVSPDGTLVAAAMAAGGVALVPLAGGDPRPLAGSAPGDVPIEWTPDGRSVYVLDSTVLGARISRIELDGGRRTLWRELVPVDRVGSSGIQKVAVTRDGTAYAYSYRQFRADLYLVKGLR